MSDANKPINPNELPPLDLQSLDAELRNEAEFGGRPIESFVGSMLSEATLGTSDVALEAAGVPAERMREVRDREAGMSMSGSAVGIIAPVVATMGASAGARALSTGVRAVTRVGAAAEAAAAKALLPRVGPTAAKIASKAAGLGAEGAIAGAGQLASDIALERRELSGESILATVGMGTLFSAGFGTVFGTAQATLPSLSKIAGGAKKIKNIVAEGLEDVTDPLEASLQVVTSTPSARLKLRERLSADVDALPKYLQEELGLETLSTPSQLMKRNREVIGEAGEQIGAISKQLDVLVGNGTVPIKRTSAYQRMLDKLDEMKKPLLEDVDINGNQIKILDDYRRTVVKRGLREAPFSFREFDDFRKSLQGKAYKGGDALESFEADVAEALRQSARETIDELAQAATVAAPELAAGLKAANKRFHIGGLLKKPLAQTANKQPGFTTPLQFVLDVAGRGARNAAVIYDVANKTAQVQELISKSFTSFFKGQKGITAGKNLSSIQVLLNSGFALDTESGKMPKSKDAAFANVQRNVQELQTDPDAMVELIAKRTARVANADPAVAAAMQSSLASAVQFLNSKLPRPAGQGGLFARAYKPSSMEMAKFERYLQVVEKPLTVLEDLQNGTLTREHVEALQAVYPEVYKELQVTAMHHITSGESNLPYNRKVQLSILLNIPGDSSLSGQSVAMLQTSINGGGAPGEDDEEAMPVSAAEGMDIAGRAETGVQELSAAE